VKINLKVRRYDPEAGDGARYQSYTVDMPEHATVLDALIQVREYIDGTLAMRCSCRSAICGSCAMRIDHRARLACKTKVVDLVKGEGQEVRVLTASLKPGDKTVFHTHRFPVTVYILEGAFTLEMEGREPVTMKAGQAMVEPPNVKMTGYNRSSTEPLRVVIFYVSDPDTPFLDPMH